MMSQQTVRFWCRRFAGDPNASVLDLPRSGAPRWGCSARNIRSVQRLIRQNNRLTIKEIATVLHISSGTVSNILHKDLHLKKLCARFIPKILTPHQKAERLRICQDNMARLAQEPLLLHHIISGDESWVYTFDPESKQKSQAWLARNDRRPTKALRSRSQRRSMLVCFLDRTGCVHHEFVQRTVNWYVYVHILGHLRERIRRRRPGLWMPGSGWVHSMLLHHDNAPTHKVNHTVARLMETNVETIEHPPYSPDLAPCDFFLFPRLKALLRGRRFPDIQALQDKVTRILRHVISLAEYHNAMVDMRDRW